MRQLVDMAGKKIGKWTVLEEAGYNKYGNITWLCQCECGREVVVVGNSLRRDKSKKCRSCVRLTHGESRTRLHCVWQDMRYRCNNKNHHDFKYYGGRGIKVCKEWNGSFETFRDWALANGYRQGLSIDRINNYGNYAPKNCWWATMKQQNRNRRNTIHIMINGVERTIAEWAKVAGIRYITLYARYHKGQHGEALLAPPRKHG